jgi:SAM-dependent methyltransferase
MNPEAMKPFGLALADYHKGNLSATLAIYRDDGYRSEIPIDVFYRESTGMNIDRIALENCYGRVLDVGAGTGLHSLYLQNQGLPVCAIDISPEACEVMRIQGLNEVYCTDIFDFKAAPFDTILILGRSIGMVENIAGLDYFLTDIHRLVNPDGQILLNSLNVTCTSNPVHLAYQETNRQAGRYIGEVRMHFEYKGLRGPAHGWLHVDPETLADHASKAGWSCEILLQEDDGNYLARLTKAN